MEPLDSDQARCLLDEIARALEQAIDLKQIKSLHARTLMLMLCIRTSGLGAELFIRAAELQLVAERKMGKILRGLHLRGGDQKSCRHADRRRLKTLKTWGISKTQSYKWQLPAKELSDAEFAAYLGQCSRQGMVATTNDLLQLARMRVQSAEAAGGGDPFGRAADDLRSLARRGKRFGGIIVDPPGATLRKRQRKAFRIDPRLAHLPVGAVAAAAAVVFLKVAPGSPQSAVRVLNAWGFTPKARLVCNELSLVPDDACQGVRDLWLVASRRPARGGLPHWIGEGDTMTIDCTEAVQARIELISLPPYLDVFSFRPFSREWTIAGR